MMTRRNEMDTSMKLLVASHPISGRSSIPLRTTALLKASLAVVRPSETIPAMMLAMIRFEGIVILLVSVGRVRYLLSLPTS